MAQYRYNESLESVLQPLADRLERELIKDGYEHDEVKGFGIDILSGVLAEYIENVERVNKGYFIRRAREHADELGITQYEN